MNDSIKAANKPNNLFEKKYLNWTNQLLDLSKRNKMINFKETSRASLKIIEPGYAEIFSKIVEKEKTLTFKKLQGDGYDYRSFLFLNLLEELKVPVELYVGDIKTNREIFDAQKSLKELRSKAKNAIEEQGINVLYLIFGFIEWTEKIGPIEKVLKSPLLLVPVSLTLEAQKKPYKITRMDDEIVTNPTLMYLFKENYGITIPEYGVEHKSIDDYFDTIEKMVVENGWNISRETNLGIVSFQKMNMYKDLVENEEMIKSSKVINGLFSGEIQNHDAVKRIKLDEVKASERFHVVNADASQQRAIILSQTEKSFVLQGPPGTGKSQTITNIIAQGLADGKKILFVSEKMAALEVVYNRLKESKLDEFCLALHNHRINKKEVIADIYSRLEAKENKINSTKLKKLENLDIKVKTLSKYAESIHKERGDSNLSLYDAYGVFLNNIEAYNFKCSISDMSNEFINDIIEDVRKFEKAKLVLGEDWEKNNWLKGKALNVNYELSTKINIIFRNTNSSIQKISQLFVSTFNEKNTILLCYNNYEDWIELLELYLHAESIPRIWADYDITVLEKNFKPYFNQYLNVKNLKMILNGKYSEKLYLIQPLKMIENINILLNNSNYKFNFDKKELDEFDIYKDIKERYNCLVEDKDSLMKIIEEYSYLAKKLEVEVQTSLKEIALFYNVFEKINGLKVISKELLCVEDLNEVINNISRYKNKRTEKEELVIYFNDKNIAELLNYKNDKVDCTDEDIYFIKKESMENSSIHDLEIVIENYKNYSSELKRIWLDLSENQYERLKENGVMLPDQVSELEGFVKIIELVNRNVKYVDSWLDNNNKTLFKTVLFDCRKKSEEYSLIKNEIIKNWKKENFDKETLALVCRVISDSDSFIKKLQKPYKQDYAFLKNNWKDTTQKLEISHVKNLCLKLNQLVEIEKWFDENKEINVKILGSKCIDYTSDWNEIDEDRNLFINCYENTNIGFKLIKILSFSSNEINVPYMATIRLIERMIELKKSISAPSIEKESSITETIKILDDSIDKFEKLYSAFSVLREYLSNYETMNVIDAISVMININKYVDNRDEIMNIVNQLKFDLGEIFDEYTINFEDIIKSINELQEIYKYSKDNSGIKKYLMENRISVNFNEESVENFILHISKCICDKDLKNKSVEDITNIIQELIVLCNNVKQDRERLQEYLLEKNIDVCTKKDLESLLLINEFEKNIEDNKELELLLENLYSGINTKWDNVGDIFDKWTTITRIKKKINIPEDLFMMIHTREIHYDKIDLFLDIMNKNMIKNDFEWISELFDEDESIRLKELPFNKLTDILELYIEQLPLMDDALRYKEYRNKCLDNGLKELVVYAENYFIKEGDLEKSVLKSIYYNWIIKVSKNIKDVNQFRKSEIEIMIKEFKELDDFQLELAKERITSKLNNVDTFNLEYSTQRNILTKEAYKKSRVMPVRKLFQNIPELVQKIKPCFMMSPLSVSYFLEAGKFEFDMVIFDEASQIFPQDAIGAIFRGKQVVIVGDTKQMPPSSFFNKSNSNEEDYDNDDYSDDIMLDSILDEASVNLPSCYLLWHYRSKHEDLIAFSNKEIYGNKLITFPSCRPRENNMGVEYIHVKNGIYHNNVNALEAKRCVSLMKIHFDTTPERSLGIIAFSARQQEKIEDEIQIFRHVHPEYDKFFVEDKDEPFFVKNLENVQGDERDTIIFSICYGKNEEGNMYMRFGPLGTTGGERRLNVAITRAKYNIKLVGSIFPDDIELTRTKSEGVRLLRSYINYAINGSDELRNDEPVEDLFKTALSDILKRRGYNVKLDVGNSSNKIDIAIEHPRYPGQYFAGIECDGYVYAETETVRDREKIKQSVLSKMGWSIYRVWSTEWIRNFENEKLELFSFIEQAKKKFVPVESEAKIIKKEVVIPNPKERSKMGRILPNGLIVFD